MSGTPLNKGKIIGLNNGLKATFNEFVTIFKNSRRKMF